MGDYKDNSSVKGGTIFTGVGAVAGAGGGMVAGLAVVAAAPIAAAGAGYGVYKFVKWFRKRRN